MKWKHFIMVYITCECIVQFLASVIVSFKADHNLSVVAVLRGSTPMSGVPTVALGSY
jgi:hypothetical protein